MSDSSIFIEKYRPQNFEEFVGQDIIVNRIKSFVENKNIPHLIFAGSPYQSFINALNEIILINFWLNDN